MKELDFEGLSSALLGRAGEFVTTWLPGGHMRGREYVCGGLRGGPGDSFSVNMDTGRWAEFAGDERGGDLISLFAAIEGIKQGEAAKELAKQIGFTLSSSPKSNSGSLVVKKDYQLGPPPPGDTGSSFLHSIYHKPVCKWSYRGPNGELLFYVARYQAPDGKKFFFPWSYATEEKRWVQKSWPAPRPLYGLDHLEARKSGPVLIVEGEKACEAARILAGQYYVCVTWPNGAKAVSKADWRPVYGRRVLIWPDADMAGREAAEAVTRQLASYCPEIKIIDTDEQPDGWDAADALEAGWDWDAFKAWAKPRARVVGTNGTVIQATAIAHSNGSDPSHTVAAASVQVQISTDENENSSMSSKETWDELGLATTPRGAPIINMDNAVRVLERLPELKGIVWFDDFHQKYFTTWRGSKREWRDSDTLDLLEFFQRTLGLSRMTENIVQQAVVVCSHKHARHEPRDWMETLTWDATPRIETFFIDYFGAPDNDYVRAVGRNFWTGLVARVYRPGCQLDNMVVLEGAQGIGKTRALRAIGGEWYTEAHESVTSRDFFMILHGKLVIEIAELDAFSKAEVTRIKQVVSCTTDRYRAPYGRTAQDHPRMSIFVGTTNEQSYLRDLTGGRRFWPIKCGIIRHDEIIKVREQLYAEAVGMYKSGANWHEMPADLTIVEQESRRQTDEWEGAIADYVIGKTEVIIRDVATECLKVDLGKLDIATQRRIGAILKSMGWTKHCLNRNGAQQKIWRPEELPFEEPVLN